jgi:hypothetical protein
MLRRAASLRSCATVRPPAPWPDRRPPRRLDDMSLIDDALAVSDSPCLARALLTVRAANSSASGVLSQRASPLSLMC